MDSTFPYSQYVSGKHFIGRRQDVLTLGNLLAQGEHVALWEPPKSGITSLVQHSLYNLRMMGRPFTVGQFSLLNLRSVQDFLLRMGSTLIRMVASTPAEYSALVGKYLSGTHFVFDPVAFAERDKVLSLSWEIDAEDIRAILHFPFRLAEDRKDRIILILDSFHCISLLENPDAVLRPLSAVLKEERGRQLSLVFAGNAVNAMKGIFEGSLLFHHLVEHVPLSRVDEAEITEYVIRGFRTGGKVVEQDLIVGACRLFQGNLWYINHFASVCDSLTRGYLLEPVLLDALDCLLSVHVPRFRSIVEGLTSHQLSYLRAVLDGVSHFSSLDVIRHYGLNSSANVKRVKDALMKKEVLRFDSQDTPSLQDPLFEYWVRKYYFEMK